jgi:peptide/nickel transport system substrate-binding protein
MNKSLVAGALAAVLVTTAGWSADLKVGLSSEPSSMDPHFHMLTPNIMMSTAVFGKLVEQDEVQNKIPGLAESWTQLAPNVWEFHLRKDVKFHDGTPFTAADVVFTFGRAGNVPNSPSSFGMFTKVVKEIEVVDDYTVRFKTAEAFPLMPDYASQIFIVSKKHGEGATTQDYDSGKAMVGTGPYKFSQFVKGDRIVYERNAAYFGDKPEWDRVIVRPITSDPARVAALLAGDVDFIDFPSTADIPNLRKNPKIDLAQITSTRLIYLHLDSNRDKAPFVTDLSGHPLDKNPLKDARVRKAMSLAINRKAITERVM